LAAVLIAQAIMAKELGQFDRAADLYTRVHDIQDRAGTAEADTATVLHNLAGLAYARMDYPRAESYALAAVARRHAVAETDTVEVGRSDHAANRTEMISMAAPNPIIVRCRYGAGHRPVGTRDARQDRDWPTRTSTDSEKRLIYVPAAQPPLDVARPKGLEPPTF
jgi:hypothetical protein